MKSFRNSKFESRTLRDGGIWFSWVVQCLPILCVLKRPCLIIHYLGIIAKTKQMADKEDMWISKQEWEEQGPRVLEKLGKR